MKTITVRFASNEEDESSGAIAGYATYRESMFFFIVEQFSIWEATYLKPFGASPIII